MALAMPLFSSVFLRLFAGYFFIILWAVAFFSAFMIGWYDFSDQFTVFIFVAESVFLLAVLLFSFYIARLKSTMALSSSVAAQLSFEVQRQDYLKDTVFQWIQDFMRQFRRVFFFFVVLCCYCLLIDVVSAFVASDGYNSEGWYYAPAMIYMTCFFYVMTSFSAGWFVRRYGKNIEKYIIFISGVFTVLAFMCFLYLLKDTSLVLPFSLSLFFHAPIFGVGFEAFSSDMLPRDVSPLILFGYQAGLVGCVFLFLIYGFLLRIAFRTMIGQESGPYGLWFLLLVLMILLVNMVVVSAAFSFFLSVCLLSAAGFLQVTRHVAKLHA